MPPTFTLLDRDGRPRPDPQSGILAGDLPRFLSGSSLSGVVVDLPQAQELRFVRLYVFGTSESLTWDSWAAAPAVPAADTLRLDVLEQPRGAAQPCPCREGRYLHKSHADLPFPDCAVIELAPRQALRAQRFALRFPPGTYCLLRIEIADAPFQGVPLATPTCRDLPRYPAPRNPVPRSDDTLLSELLAQSGSGEPQLAAVWRVALPFLGTALLGIVEGPMATATWDGGLIFPADRDDETQPERFARHYLKLDLGPLSDPLAVTAQRLHQGWLPIHEVRASAGGLRLLQTSFVDQAGALRCRWLIENQGAKAHTLRPQLRAVRSRLVQAEGPSWPDLTLPLGRCFATYNEPLPVGLIVTRDESADSAQRSGAPFVELRVGERVGRLWPARPLTIPAGGIAAVELSLPLQTPPALDTGSFEQAMHGTEAHWATFVQTGAQLDVPDAHLQDLWRATHVHNRLFQRGGKMRYGCFPSAYQDAIFGVEEGWNLVALALYGHGDLAQRLLARTFFEEEFLKKEGQHHQYRNGLAVLYAMDIFRLTGDRDFLHTVYATIAKSARWIIRSLHSTRVSAAGQRPAYFGLMPKHTYGGDLKTPAYSLYGSSTCWRGLHDAAQAALVLGHGNDAAEFRHEADLARRHMHEAAERIYKHDGKPPFLPFQVDEPGDQPAAREYHQLFASLILETALFGWQGRFARSITGYLQETGRLVMGVARFDQWFGRLGIDAEYTRGVQLSHLCRRDFDRFYEGLLGQVGLSCDPVTFTSPETSIVRFSAQDYRDRMRTLAWDPHRVDSDPCSAGTAVMLQYLRYLLCFEERDEDDVPTGALWLAPAAPRSYFTAGARFGFRDLPTAVGARVTLQVRSSADEVVYDVALSQPTLCELFYFDRAGQRRSQRQALTGHSQVRLAR